MQLLTECQPSISSAMAGPIRVGYLTPVVNLFTPWPNATWLLTKLNPDGRDSAFGLCDLGLGSLELGYVSLSELRSLRGPAGLTAELDLSFKAAKTLQA